MILYLFESDYMKPIKSVSKSVNQLSRVSYEVDDSYADEATYYAALDEIKSQCDKEPNLVSKNDIIQQINQY